MDSKRIFKDKKKPDIIKDLRKEVVILKPDKGNGIVLVRNINYYKGLKNLFSDRISSNKLKKILHQHA